MRENRVSYSIAEVYRTLDWLADSNLELAIDYINEYSQEDFIEQISIIKLSELKESLLDLRMKDINPHYLSYDIASLLESIDELLASDSLEQYSIHKDIITAYREQVFFISYDGDQADYEKRSDTLDRVIGSIRFK